MITKQVEGSHLPQLRSRGGFTGREAVAAAFAIAAEAIVVLLAFSADVTLHLTLLVHVVASAIVGLILFYGRPREDDLTIAALIFLVVAVAGPAGAIASLTALAFVDHAGAGPEVLHAWYARLAQAGGSDPATELNDRITAGRVLQTEAPAPHTFENIIADGTLAERQAALGLRARHFHTDFAPALEAALRSPEPVVRVQAAAVVARIRADLKTRIKAMVAAPFNLEIEDAAELLRLSACPLVDRQEGEKCRKAANEVLKIALVTGHDVQVAASTADAETAPVIERFLMNCGRLRDFRISRRIHGLVLGGGYRVRLPQRHPGVR